MSAPLSKELQKKYNVSAQPRTDTEREQQRHSKNRRRVVDGGQWLSGTGRAASILVLRCSLSSRAGPLCVHPLVHSSCTTACTSTSGI